MSDAAENKKDGKSSSRRRTPRRRGPKKDDKPKDAPAKESKEPKDKPIKKPRDPPTPLPENLVGKASVGTISTVITRARGKVQFGFIELGDKLTNAEDSPRIYVNFKDDEKDIRYRRGYQVNFTCKVDDENRQFASDLSLTDEGKVQLADFEKLLAEKKAAEGDKPKKPVETQKRKKRSKKVLEPKIVKLSLTCEGKPEVKEIQFDVNQGLGRLKRIAAQEFELPLTISMHDSGKVFLTKAKLQEMTDGNTVGITVDKTEENK